MATRLGMATLIDALRQATNAGSADYTLGTTTYFSDEQLQSALDRTQRLVTFQPLDTIEQAIAGVVWTVDYSFAEYGTWFEQNSASGTAFYVRDSAGNAQGTALWAANYDSRLVTFNGGTVSTNGSVYYVDAKVYDVYAAAAEVWGKKAAYYQTAVDWQSDNHRVSNSQLYRQALNMQAYYEGQAESAVGYARMRRVDETEADTRTWGVNEGWI